MIDLKGFRAAVLFAVLAAIANGVWILLDHSVPAWDESHYLTVTWQYHQALSEHGPVNLLQAIHSVDPSRGPLFPVLMLPLEYVFGAVAHLGPILNFLIAPVLYIAAGEIAMIVFRDWRARLLAILLVATMPLMVGLYHYALQDFLLVTLATLSILMLLKTELFSRRLPAAALGVTMGLGTLTKVTFPAFIVGPIAIVLAQTAASAVRDRRSGDSEAVRVAGLNVGLALAILLVITLPWYLSNLSPTLEYIEWTTESGLGAGPEHPFTAHAFFAFVAGVMNGHVSWITGLIAIAALLLCFPAILDWYRARPLRRAPLIGVGLLASWFLIPFFSVAFAHNQDVRLMAAAMPALAILIAGAIAAIRLRWARNALIVVAAVALVFQTTSRVIKIDPSFLPESVTVHIGSQFAAIPLASQTIGYEHLPGEDRATPILRYIESLAGFDRNPPAAAPSTLCLLESEPVANGNTFGYLADTRGDPLVVTTIAVYPFNRAELPTFLEECSFALYVKQPKRTGPLEEDRLAIVNSEMAASYMTPALLHGFKGPRRTFYVGSSNPDRNAPKYLTFEKAGEYVTVLSREKVGSGQ